MDLNVLKQLTRYIDFFPNETKIIQEIIENLSGKKDIFDRKTNPAHITASGMIRKNKKLLMIYHSVLKKWLQPGGHVENNETPLNAAIREVKEETGLNVKPHLWHQDHLFPFDIDIHKIPENATKSEAAHLHYDFRYLLVGQGDQGLAEHLTFWKNISDIKQINMISIFKKIDKLEIEKY